MGPRPPRPQLESPIPQDLATDVQKVQGNFRLPLRQDTQIMHPCLYPGGPPRILLDRLLAVKERPRDPRGHRGQHPAHGVAAGGNILLNNLQTAILNVEEPSERESKFSLHPRNS